MPKGEPIANFSGHANKLVCGLWSPSDPDVVITGADDFTVRAWKVSEQKDTLPSKDGKFSLDCICRIAFNNLCSFQF